MNVGVVHHLHLLARFLLEHTPRWSDVWQNLDAVRRKVSNLDSFVSKFRDNIRDEVVTIFQRMTSLERRIENLESSGRGDSRARNELHEVIVESQRAPRAQQTIHSYNGTLLWKIEDYQRKRQDAINGVKTALYSHPFYSAQFGYKMCAKIYMNGDGFGKGSHLSLFFVVMKGDYDALQTWPFQKKITMMLLDQGNGDHMIDAVHSDPQSSSFQRPKSDMNIASGSSLFMPLDSLSNRQYIKDDVMFVKIIVD